jgi:hypothetical protein
MWSIEMPITKFQKWILKGIFKEIVTQGPHHEKNIIKVYTLLREAARTEFFEETNISLNDFLSDCFEKSLDRENYWRQLIGEEEL